MAPSFIQTRIHDSIHFQLEKVGISGFLLFIIVLIPHAYAQPVVVYFGDSITEGWINAEYRPEEAFPNLTDSILAKSQLHCISVNKGVGGNTTEDALARISSDVLRLHPMLVVVEFSWNDCLVDRVTGQPHVDLESFRRNYENIVSHLKMSGCLVMLLSLPGVDTTRFYNYFESTLYTGVGGIRNHVLLYDSVIYDISQTMNTEYLKVDYTASVGTKDMYAFDGLHPSEAGHKVIAQTLAPAIHAVLHSWYGNTDIHALTVYPQPVNRLMATPVTIQYNVERTGRSRIAIANEAGRTVAAYTVDNDTKGIQKFRWNSRTSSGVIVPSGVYFILVQTSTNRHATNIIIE